MVAQPATHDQWLEGGDSRAPASDGFPSGRAHRVEKLANLELEAVAFPGQ